MEWIEADVYTTPEGIEAVCGFLMAHGITGLQIENNEEMQQFIRTNPFHWDYVEEELVQEKNEDVYVKFYLSQTEAGVERLNYMKQDIVRLKELDVGLDLGTLEIRTKNVDEEQWVNEWKKYYKPLEIGEKVAVKPTWEPYDNKEGRVVFTIDPGHVFGTGLHQSTQLCIERIEQYVTNQTAVLDLGCGTGILSIISLLLGAKDAWAIDMEPDAVPIAYENAAMNHISKERYTVLSGNILTDQGLRDRVLKNHFDLVVANIVADVIIGISSFVGQLLASGGIFISSGIISQRTEDVIGALEGEGFHIHKTFQKDDWVLITAVKK